MVEHWVEQDASIWYWDGEVWLRWDAVTQRWEEREKPPASIAVDVPTEEE